MIHGLRVFKQGDIRFVPVGLRIVNKPLDRTLSVCNNTVQHRREYMTTIDTKSNLDISSEGNAAVVTFKSAYISDVEEISGDSAKIRQFINKHHPQQVIFDFAGVKFFSSQVLGVLLEARSQLKSSDGRVVVCTLDPRLHRVFKITNLDRIFPLYPDRPSALDAITS